MPRKRWLPMVEDRVIAEHLTAPDKQRGYDQFFFQSSSKSPLTPCFQA